MSCVSNVPAAPRVGDPLIEAGLDTKYVAPQRHHR